MSLRKFRFMQRSCVWGSVAVLVFQPQFLFAAEQPTASAPSTPARAMAVVDVELQPDGLLLGQLVDGQGRPLSATTIQLTSKQKKWQVQTDQQGRFQLKNMTGATYTVQSGQQVQLVRAWAPGTAPPSATKGLLFVQDGDLVLAQHCASPVCGSAVAAAKHPLANPWVVGGLVAAAIAIPVAIHNSNNDSTPASP